jgi:hypothetical protein
MQVSGRVARKGAGKSGPSLFAACICTLPLLLIAPVITSATGFAAAPTASSNAVHTPFTASPAGTPAPTESNIKSRNTHEPAISPDSVISFLSAAINWYRHLDVEQTVATQPAEMLYLADDRAMAQKALTLAFEFARSVVALLQSTASAAKPASQNASKAATLNGVPVIVVPNFSSKLV